LYIALQCVFCPEAVRKLIPLAVQNQLIRLAIFDAALFSEFAKADGIRSVPTVVLNGHYRWTGDPPVPDIVNMMIHRDPARLSASSIERMLKEGEAEQVAKMMTAHGRVFPAFIKLLVSDKWPVRLGAMVAMEALLEKNADIAAQAAETLWDRVQTVDKSVKGDILYILGKIGHADMVPKLETLSADFKDKDLQEAAREATESIKRKQTDTGTRCNEDADACSLPDFPD
jgi:glutaredoxin